MLILTIRTDKPKAEISLFNNTERLACETWQAHRLLAETIHRKLDGLLRSRRYELKDLQGIAVFQGPGSFTGLRIGVSVANALADSLTVPIIGAGITGDDWVRQAITRLQRGQNERVVLPEYGAPPRITRPKH